jgi:hypothetical protein
MPHFFVKPVVWNSTGYQHPSGQGASSGFPSDYGFGGEDWNNADDGLVDIGDGPIRLFYTRPLGKVPVDDFAGDIVLLMTASHDGAQYLVGVAWGATYVGDHPDRAFYNGLVDGKRRREDAWSIPAVRAKFTGRKAFNALWNAEASYPINWVCPADGFTWFEEPRLLDPVAITGKAKLISMFGSYQALTEDEADRALAKITVSRPVLRNPLAEDLATLEADGTLLPTEREALAKARIGQGRFRLALLRRWHGCAVTGCTIEALLTASHVKPWRDSTNIERLDPENGLLLVPTLDRLFDRGLITFAMDGSMVPSPLLPPAEKKRLSLKGKLRYKLSKGEKAFLAHHRAQVFKSGHA